MLLEMKPFVFIGWIALGLAVFVALFLSSVTGNELFALPLYPLLAVFWIWGKLRERSDAARSTGSR